MAAFTGGCVRCSGGSVSDVVQWPPYVLGEERALLDLWPGERKDVRMEPLLKHFGNSAPLGPNL